MAFNLNSRFIKVVQSYVKPAVGFAAVSVVHPYGAMFVYLGIYPL